MVERRRKRSLLQFIRMMLGWCVVVFIFLAAGTAGSDWYAWRAFEKRVEAVRAEGERVLPKDFKPQDDDPPDNAAPDLTAAAAIVDDDSVESDSVSWVPATMPSTPKAWPYLERAVDYFQPALQRIARAQTKALCVWGHSFKSPIEENMMVPELRGNRALADLLSAAALVEHRRGQDDLVVQRLGQLLYVSRTCESVPMEIGHKCALGIASTAAGRVEQFAPDLRIGDERGFASVPEVRRLIAALLDEASTTAGLQLSLDADRMCMVDRIASLARGDDGVIHMDAWMRFFMNWQIYANGRFALDRYTAIARAPRGTSNWPAAKARLDALGRIEDRLFVTDYLENNKHDLRNHFQVLTDGRMAATALAIRLYQVDHAGRRPQRLEELVPRYLQAVPLDAMAGDGRAIRYLADGEHPLLYSVGVNGGDDAASEAAMPGVRGEVDEWRRLDRVFNLTARDHPWVYVPYPEGVVFGGYAGEPSRAPWERDEVPAATSRTSPGASTPPAAP